MPIIIHKIKLHDVAHLEAFKQWVITTDYRACEDLDSVLSFEVALVSQAADAPFHLIEMIHLSSTEAFEAEMASPLFQSLVARFSQMAEVVEEILATRIGDGYLSS
jgi:hypothetical protein